MIELRPISKAVQAKHLALLSKRFWDALATSPLNGKIQYPVYIKDLIDYLALNLERILSGAPEELVVIINEVKRRFPAFHAQAQRKRSSKGWKKHIRDAAAVNLIEQCFDYGKFSRKAETWGAYALIDSVGTRVCPYCQLHHVNYHFSGQDGFSLRPPLDHFFPKATYPYLAVSLTNLVPCCSQCNSSVKLALDPLIAAVPHPRAASAMGRIKFSAQGSVPIRAGGKRDLVKLEVVACDCNTEAHVKAFKLRERYSWYSSEVHDLMKNYIRFLEYPSMLKGVMWNAEFVLGFAPQTAPDRALGVCLLDIWSELESGAIV